MQTEWEHRGHVGSAARGGSSLWHAPRFSDEVIFSIIAAIIIHAALLPSPPTPDVASVSMRQMVMSILSDVKAAVVDEWGSPPLPPRPPRDSVCTAFNSSAVGISFSEKNTHVIIQMSVTPLFPQQI